jgi:trimethylguanosine synthase
VSPLVEKYWFQRYHLFSRYDEGIRMDEEGWYSVTPEQIAIRHARRCVAAASNSNPLVIDCFAGVGGNAIQFARMCCSVVAIDIDPHKLELAIHNAKIYGVQHCIDFIIGDFFQLAPLLKVMLIIEIRLNVV